MFSPDPIRPGFRSWTTSRARAFPEVRHHLFLAMKEAIHNVIKHSKPPSHPASGNGGGAFEARLEDNGRDFLRRQRPNPSARDCPTCASEFRNWRAARGVSAPGKGTSVRIRILLETFRIGSWVIINQPILFNQPILCPSKSPWLRTTKKSWACSPESYRLTRISMPLHLSNGETALSLIPNTDPRS